MLSMRGARGVLWREAASGSGDRRAPKSVGKDCRAGGSGRQLRARSATSNCPTMPNPRPCHTPTARSRVGVRGGSEAAQLVRVESASRRPARANSHDRSQRSPRGEGKDLWSRLTTAGGRAPPDAGPRTGTDPTTLSSVCQPLVLAHRVVPDGAGAGSRCATSTGARWTGSGPRRRSRRSRRWPSRRRRSGCGWRTWRRTATSRRPSRGGRKGRRGAADVGRTLHPASSWRNSVSRSTWSTGACGPGAVGNGSTPKRRRYARDWLTIDAKLRSSIIEGFSVFRGLRPPGLSP